MAVKTKIKELKHSRFAVNRWIFYSLKQVWTVFKFVFYGSYRSLTFTKIRYGNHYLQGPTLTLPNRYPLLFKACADYLSKTANPKILSFGCSTGEEVFSIGKLIPEAQILGVDINPWCIRQAKKKTTSPNHTFVHRLSQEFESAGPFDAIFCMAVFQRPENRHNKDNSQTEGILFEQFEKEIIMLDKKLRPGGLLIIDHADFRFSDTSVSQNYKPLSTFEQNNLTRNRPVFDRNNKKIAEKNDSYRVFVKS